MTDKEEELANYLKEHRGYFLLETDVDYEELVRVIRSYFTEQVNSIMKDII